jgi:hypothetical protein
VYTPRMGCKRAGVFVALVLSVAGCGGEPEPAPLTDQEVFAACELELLCPRVSGSDDPAHPDTVPNHLCVFEALRDRRVGHVSWAFASSLPASPLVDVFIGSDGRVLHWGRSEGSGVVREVTLRPPEFFAECIAALEQGEWTCHEGSWYEDGAVEVEAECLTP